MRIVKMSLVAALLVGSSAFAVENLKVSGDANVFYGTTDAKNQTSNVIAGKAATDSGSLFDKDSSAADAGLNLNATADLFSNDMVTVSTGAGYTALSTLGLENNFVSNVWGGAHTATTPTNANGYGDALNGAKVENASWFNEAYVTVATGKTIAKIGRMELDTPLAFTEKWSIEKNTFEAAVLINQDIPDTTVVAAFVGTGNGTEAFGQNAQSNVQALDLAMGPIVNADGNFATYGENGAYALGVVNNSVEPLTAQAWYYDVSKLAQAYWLQADLSMEGMMAGAQYSNITIEKSSATLENVALVLGDVDSSVYAVMLGYEMKDMFTAKVAYSAVDKDHSAGFNTATAMDTAQTKLYTEAWWNYGRVTQADTVAYNLTVEVPVQDVADFGVYYTYADQAKNTGPNDLTEFTLTAGQSFGPLDATLAIINAKVAKADATNTVQAYVTLNF